MVGGEGKLPVIRYDPAHYYRCEDRPLCRSRAIPTRYRSLSCDYLFITRGNRQPEPDMAKALALGADARLDRAPQALRRPRRQRSRTGSRDYETLGHARPAPYDDWHEGRDPAGITTQDPDLAKRLDPIETPGAASPTSSRC